MTWNLNINVIYYLTYFQNIFFLECEEYPEDFSWKKENIIMRILHMTARLHVCMSEGKMANYICKDIDAWRIKTFLQIMAVAYAQENVGLFLGHTLEYMEMINTGQNPNLIQILNSHDPEFGKKMLRMSPHFWSCLDNIGCFD